ncbi:endonuclease/exonuclease/phosphatase family protein [Bacillus sp. DX1.1]|uniref:endonuclease/exonuclease/phosphatase family protein n=1 Tax=unclassified Bacillus (in: firmicutes) TaxID=185979 RepID=UPI0025712A32|nr:MULTISPECIES: endonuclease/exonuclease/phosphatase family protein [unclassified Bacillus (in: firmicutes)]MDM5152987.1 endonuclease/exonuclease/phosphatase family protein [Bacillus sp. DX1.1]WJE81965.1 endonuclease/exonuclease/phosphatase family protein [Bacillus sp. DX3.1]
MFKKSFVFAFILLLSMIPMFSYNSKTLAAEPPMFERGNETDIKVMSYNIHHGEGVDAILDLKRIADIIKQSGADIIGLQEVDKHFSERSNFEDQVKWLANYLGMKYTYAANLDYEPLPGEEHRRQYGTAALSKYPILSSKNHLLTNIPYPVNPTEQRGLLETVINVKGNHIRFYNTHLDNKRAEQRDLQIQEILEIAKQKERTSIFAGDFNATPESPEILKMTAQYKDVFAELDQNEDFTIPVDKPNRRIDYIFTSEDVKICTGEVINTFASDHLPITAELMLTKKTPFNNGLGKN